MLHAGRGLPQMGTAQVETGGHAPKPGRHMLKGQLRMESVPTGLSLHPASRATNSPARMARRSLFGLGFRIVLGW